MADIARQRGDRMTQPFNELALYRHFRRSFIRVRARATRSESATAFHRRMAGRKKEDCPAAPDDLTWVLPLGISFVLGVLFHCFGGF